MGNYKELLLAIAKNPAMIYWLDNNDNHADAVNENWGRELLELFSMGVGNYTEVDVRECSRAFTGWTFEAEDSQRSPWDGTTGSSSIRAGGPRRHRGRPSWAHTGRFNGEDIIDIICAASRQRPGFICPSPLQLLRGRRSTGACLVGDSAEWTLRTLSTP